MAAMVRRRVWYLNVCSIESGTVTGQHFDPDYLTVMPDSSSSEITLSSNRAFLKPEDAIQDAREFAALLLDNAKNLEATIEA